MSDDKLKPCPFCGETDFDLVGLKSHLDHGYCETYNETINLPRMFPIHKEGGE